MALEIERKFLLREGAQLPLAREVIPIQQGYLAKGEHCVVRVRLTQQQGFITIKGKPSADHLSRPEYEYPIPPHEAQQLLTLCPQLIKKERLLIEHKGYIWQVDRFTDQNEGLILAEIELENPSEQPPLPCWIGPEVTTDPRYYNAYLAQHPYRYWNTLTPPTNPNP